LEAAGIIFLRIILGTTHSLAQCHIPEDLIPQILSAESLRARTSCRYTLRTQVSCNQLKAIRRPTVRQNVMYAKAWTWT